MRQHAAFDFKPASADAQPASRVRFAGLRPPLTPPARQNTAVSTHSKFNRGQKQYPLLAQEAFDETIDFPEMSAADRKSLKASLAGQIARTGTALALIKNDKGNAYAISYLLTANRPTKIYYQASFLKAGEFDEAKYEVVLTAPGSMNVTGRGQPSEQFKPLFQK